MTKWNEIQTSHSSAYHVYPGVSWLGMGRLGGWVVLCSCLWAFGCSTSPEPLPPQPSTQEIRSDADRFFEKLDQEQQEKPATKP